MYDRLHDRYHCPAGHYLYPYKKVDGRSTKRYRLVGGHCQHCALRQTCLPDNLILIHFLGEKVKPLLLGIVAQILLASNSQGLNVIAVGYKTPPYSQR